MKVFGIIVVLLLLAVGSVVAVNYTQDTTLVTLDNTTLCLPKEYTPGVSSLGQWLERHVDGLDSTGHSIIVRLPALLIKEGVPEYQLSHINQHGVERDHEINGIAHNAANVGNANALLQCIDEFSTGMCYQALLYKDVYYQYSIATVESKHSTQINAHLYALFERWDNSCLTD